MTPERLLAEFSRVADAPDAVPRLRRFVLDLAVRGKLVPQDSADKPASELLKRIAAQKALLVKKGEMRAPKPLPTHSAEALPFVLPANWRWSQLAEIGIISPRNEAADDVPASFVPMTMIAAEYGVPHEHEVRTWAEIKKGYTHFAEGDVALAKITPCFENAKSTVFRNLEGGIGAGTTELHVVRPIFVDRDYLLIFLKCPHFIQSGVPRMTGTAGQKRVPTEYFANTPFPLPPLAEQRRIVAKVDELMGLCDRLEAARGEREATRDRLTAASLARLNTPDPDPALFAAHARFALTVLPTATTRPDQIKPLRQTILNLAVRGLLVPQDAKEGTANAFLKQIKSARAEQSVALGRSRRPSAEPNVAIEAPFELPGAWQWVCVDDCFDVGGGLQKTPIRTPLNNPHPYLGVGNVYRGRLDLSEVKQFELFEGELDRFRLVSGDILVVEGNGSANEIGRCAIWRGEIADCIHQNHIIRCRPVIDAYSDYVARYLNSPIGIDIMKALAVTSSGLFSLSVSKIRNIMIPLPPLAEQHRIVARVDSLMALCDRLEANLAAGATTRTRLLDALLAEALAPAAASATEAAAA